MYLYWDILIILKWIHIGIVHDIGIYIYVYMANYKMDTLMDPSVPCQEAKHLLRKCLDPQGQRSYV